MAKPSKRPNLPPEHNGNSDKWYHEQDLIDMFGYSWSTWERNYRTTLPGLSTPHGRWYLEKDVIAWFDTVKTSR